MCGIAGLVALDSAAPIDGDLLQKMCAVIRHRGPNDDGFHLAPTVGLGMRRLSIIDLSGGHQPVYNEDRTACVVFNGEIYNYKDLVTQLEGRGHRFATHRDTETIIHAYEEWGEATPEHLHGMFAFAIWDSQRSKLFIARDRLGKKPLYYTQDQRQFVFGSEIKSLLLAKPACRQINVQALDAYLSLGYVPGPDTLFTGIYKLPAGHCLTLVEGRVNIREYWDLRFDHEHPISLDECCERVRYLLTDAVRVRLMSDVPLGAFLSGGIDSSVVVGLMSQLMSQPVDTFSVGFEEEVHNELPFAGLIAQHFGTHHHELMVNTCSPELFERLVWHFDEPVADPAAVPTMLVSELARRHVTVVLTGEGGDELFAGYDYYRSARARQPGDFVPASVRRQVLPALARTANAILGRPRYHERTIWFWSLPPHKQILAAAGVFTDAGKASLYHPTFRSQGTEDATGAILKRAYDRSGARHELSRRMYWDTKVWLADDLLMKVDKMSMSHSIEARTPYLDHRLMEFMATVPVSLKVDGGIPKRILKEVAKTILPDAIINRRKHTFDVPIGKWLTGSLRELTLDVVASGRVGGRPIFNPDYITGELWRGLQAGDRGSARQLWTLLNLGLWAKRYDMQLS
ncbi:MAG: asparagine synthase (glutamine-hydrolyzing) [Anaerolineales bacterium]